MRMLLLMLLLLLFFIKASLSSGYFPHAIKVVAEVIGVSFEEIRMPVIFAHDVMISLSRSVSIVAGSGKGTKRMLMSFGSFS